MRRYEYIDPVIIKENYELARTIIIYLKSNSILVGNHPEISWNMRENPSGEYCFIFLMLAVLKIIFDYVL